MSAFVIVKAPYLVGSQKDSKIWKVQYPTRPSNKGNLTPILLLDDSESVLFENAFMIFGYGIQF